MHVRWKGEIVLVLKEREELVEYLLCQSLVLWCFLLVEGVKAYHSPYSTVLQLLWRDVREFELANELVTDVEGEEG